MKEHREHPQVDFIGGFLMVGVILAVVFLVASLACKNGCCCGRVNEALD